MRGNSSWNNKISSLSLIKDNERWEVEEPVILKENVSDLVNHQKRTDFMPIGNKIDFSHAILPFQPLPFFFSFNFCLCYFCLFLSLTLFFSFYMLFSLSLSISLSLSWILASVAVRRLSDCRQHAKTRPLVTKVNERERERERERGREACLCYSNPSSSFLFKF